MLRLTRHSRLICLVIPQCLFFCGCLKRSGALMPPWYLCDKSPAFGGGLVTGAFTVRLLSVLAFHLQVSSFSFSSVFSFFSPCRSFVLPLAPAGPQLGYQTRQIGGTGRS